MDEWLGSWGPFLESPETLRAHLGLPFSLYVQNEGVLLEARIFAVTLIFIPFSSNEKTNFTD